MFYLFVAESGQLHISPLIDDKHLRGRVEVLLPGLPLGFAQTLLHEICGKRSGSAQMKILSLLSNNQRRKGKARDADEVKSEIIETLQKKPSLATQPWHWVSKESLQYNDTEENQVESQAESQEADAEKICSKNWTKDYAKEQDFHSRTNGRLLAKVDLQRLGQECGLPYSEILSLSHDRVVKGEAEWIPAVKREGNSWRCQRCGETEVEEWTSIYGLAATCPSCTALGAVSSLHALYRSVVHSGDESKSCNTSFTRLLDEIPFVFSPRWGLSDAQKLAAQEVLEFVKEESINAEMLLWAACGAGKTEVCFPATAWALGKRKKVLFAAPRQDVVLDVAPRIQQDFPGLKLSVLTGTSPERFTPASFVLATTHQILRFFQAFDLIFLDEMDAFPYYGNAALVWGVEQALRPGGKIVYLTATPSPESLEKVRQGGMRLIRLPARHHRKAIPIPEWRKISGELKPEGLGHREQGQKIFSWIRELSRVGPVLFFVPKISWVNPWVEILQKEFPQWGISGSYSADPLRREKIEGLRSKEFQVFVSTSILERGVTIPNAQVMVLGADHEVFDERALVQMAGRVGRTQNNPTGNAVFLSSKKTPIIEKAIHWIREQNELAFKQGLID